MLEGVRDYAILMLSPEGRILTWNAGAQAMKGYGAQEIIGQSFSRFYTEADLHAQKPCKLLEVAARDGRVSDEGWRVRKDGSRFWASVVITAFYDETGAVQGYAKITRDMTELHETLQRLEAANQRLRELDEAKSFTISAASHELRSPLTSIKGYVENLVEGVAGPLPEQVMYLFDSHRSQRRSRHPHDEHVIGSLPYRVGSDGLATRARSVRRRSLPMCSKI